jgi:hypothetical protein
MRPRHEAGEEFVGLVSGRARIMGQNFTPGQNERQRGNTMVETALVFIPIIVLFFGIIDFSFARHEIGLRVHQHSAKGLLRPD